MFFDPITHSTVVPAPRIQPRAALAPWSLAQGQAPRSRSRDPGHASGACWIPDRKARKAGAALRLALAWRPGRRGRWRFDPKPSRSSRSGPSGCPPGRAPGCSPARRPSGSHRQPPRRLRRQRTSPTKATHGLLFMPGVPSEPTPSPASWTTSSATTGSGSADASRSPATGWRPVPLSSPPECASAQPSRRDSRWPSLSFRRPVRGQLMRPGSVAILPSVSSEHALGGPMLGREVGEDYGQLRSGEIRRPSGESRLT